MTSFRYILIVRVTPEKKSVNARGRTVMHMLVYEFGIGAIKMAIRIFIDQGHNPYGPNTGAEGYGLKEQDITYEVGVLLAELLRADSRFEVMLSRNSPTEQLGTSNAASLAARVRAANAWPADYFISIHANANENPDINGTEVYVYRMYTQSYYLAQHILDAIVNIVGTKDNGVRVNSSLYVLRRTNMPAVLVELAYLTNEADAKKLETMQPEFARGIYEGLLSYFGLDQ